MSENILITGVVNGQRSEGTKKAYVGAIKRWLKFAGEEPAAWTVSQVEAWRDYLKDENKSTAYINSSIAALKYAAKRYATRYNEKDFTLGAEMIPNHQEKKVKPLTKDEINKLFSACQDGKILGIRDEAILSLAYNTGMRRSSIAGITFEDLKENKIEITLKGGKRHQVPIDKETIKVICRWKFWLESIGIKSGPLFRGLRESTIDNTITIAKTLSSWGIYAALKKRAKKVGIVGFHPHRLRHTFISESRRAGYADWQIAQVTGHALPGSKSHLDTYTNVQEPIELS